MSAVKQNCDGMGRFRRGSQIPEADARLGDFLPPQDPRARAYFLRIQEWGLCEHMGLAEALGSIDIEPKTYFGIQKSMVAVRTRGAVGSTFGAFGTIWEH